MWLIVTLVQSCDLAGARQGRAGLARWPQGGAPRAVLLRIVITNENQLHLGYRLAMLRAPELMMRSSVWSSARLLHQYSLHLLSELETAELFIISSLRLWFLARLDRERLYPCWRHGFARMGISCRGAWGFDQLCRILGTTAVRSLDIHQLQCPRIGDYEAGVVRALGFIQHDRLKAAQSALLDWCPASAVRVALEPVGALADALHERSLLIPMREQGAHGSRLPRVNAPDAAVRPEASVLLH